MPNPVIVIGGELIYPEPEEIILIPVILPLIIIGEITAGLAVDTAIVLNSASVSTTVSYSPTN